MRPVTDLMWKALVDTYDALMGWFAGLSIDPTAWSGFTWLIVAGVVLLLLTLLLRPRRAWKERRPELLISHGEVVLRDPEAHKAVTFATSAPAHAPFELRMTVSNLGSTPIQLLELSVLTNGAQAPNSAEVGAVVPPHGAVDVAAEVHEMAGDEGRIDLFVYVPNMRPKTFRLRARLRWEPWNARFRLVPLEQRIDKARGLASSARYRREAAAWRRGLAKERATLSTAETEARDAATSGRRSEPTWAEAPSFVPSEETAKPRAERSVVERPVAGSAVQQTDVETTDRIPAAAPRSAARPRPSLAPETHRRAAARPQRDSVGAGSREVESKPTDVAPVREERGSLERGRTVPMRTGPMRTGPMRTGPMRTAPIRIEPTRASSTDDEPLLDEPAPTEPLRSQPIRSLPGRLDRRRGAEAAASNEGEASTPGAHEHEAARADRSPSGPPDRPASEGRTGAQLGPWRPGEARGGGTARGGSEAPLAGLSAVTKRLLRARRAQDIGGADDDAADGSAGPGVEHAISPAAMPTSGRTGPTSMPSEPKPMPAAGNASHVGPKPLSAEPKAGPMGPTARPAAPSQPADRPPPADPPSPADRPPPAGPLSPASGSFSPASAKPVTPTGPAASASEPSDAEPARPRLEFPDDFD